MKNILALLAVIIGLQSSAHGALLLEPYFGYQAMVMDLKTGTTLGSIPFKMDATGVAYGLRLGYSGMLLFAALDVTLGGLNMKLKEGPPVLSQGATLHASSGGTFGLNLPFLRPYVGYIYNEQSKGSDSGFTGTGYKAGIGVGILPKIKINLEYFMSTFTKFSAGTEEVTLPNAATYESASMSGFMLTMSAPLTF